VWADDDLIVDGAWWSTDRHAWALFRALREENADAVPEDAGIQSHGNEGL
jgi:hypothetical protein